MEPGLHVIEELKSFIANTVGETLTTATSTTGSFSYFSFLDRFLSGAAAARLLPVAFFFLISSVTSNPLLQRYRESGL